MAVLAGAVSFASPCVVPLVPGYLAYLAGLVGADAPPASVDEARGAAGGSVAGRRGRGAVRRRVHRRVRRDPRRCRVAGRRAGAQRAGAAARRRRRDDRDGPGVRRARAGPAARPPPALGAAGGPLGCAAARRGVRAGLGAVPRADARRGGRRRRRHRRRLAARGSCSPLAYCVGLGVPFVRDRARRPPGGAAPWAGCAGTPGRSRSAAASCWSRSGCCWSPACGAGCSRGCRCPSPASPRCCSVDDHHAPHRRPAGRRPAAAAAHARAALPAQHLARPDEHAHRADAAVPARGRRAARGAAAAALAEPAPVDQYFTEHPTLGPAARPAAVLRRLRRALVRRGLPAAVHLAGRLPGAAHGRARPRACASSRSPRRATSPGCPHARRARPSTSRSAEVEARARRRAARLAGGLARRAGAGWIDDGPHGLGRARARCARSATSCSTSACSACSSAFAVGKIVRLRGPGHRAGRRRPVLQLRHPRLRLVPPRPAGRRHGPAARSACASTTSPRRTCPAGSPRATTPPSATRRRRTSPRAPTPGARRHRGEPPAAHRRRAGSTCSATATRPGSPSPSRTASSASGACSGGRSTRPRCCPRARRSSTRRASPTRRSAARSQLAITGLFAPTRPGGQVVTSVFPALNDPEVAVDVLRGDLGLDYGRGQSIFSVDQGMVDQGRLMRVARENMQARRRDHARRRHPRPLRRRRDWVSLQVSHDPGQMAVLITAIALLGGLTLSLTVRRRRFWVRAAPARRVRRWSYGGDARRAGTHGPRGLRRGVRAARGRAGRAGRGGADTPCLTRTSRGVRAARGDAGTVGGRRAGSDREDLDGH